jgi:hypothetical protein
MILLKLKGDKVIGVYHGIDPNHIPLENEVMVESLPHIELQENEIAYIYYRNKNIEYEKEIRNGTI